jgi:hypothetical protein
MRPHQLAEDIRGCSVVASPFLSDLKDNFSQWTECRGKLQVSRRLFSQNIEIGYDRGVVVIKNWRSE